MAKKNQTEKGDVKKEQALITLRLVENGVQTHTPHPYQCIHLVIFYVFFALVKSGSV